MHPLHSDEQRHHFATIAAAATAVPSHVLTREDVKTYMRQVFDVGERRLDAMMTVIDNAQVHQRHSIFPIEYLVEPRPLAQTSQEYQEHAVRLGQQAAVRHDGAAVRSQLCEPGQEVGIAGAGGLQDLEP